MAFIQQLNVPPNKIIPFAVRDMTGGVNNRSSVLKNSEASNIANMSFYDEVTMERRLGTKDTGVVPLSGAVTFVGEYKPYNDADQTIYASNSSMRIGTATKVLSGEMDGENFLGKYFIVDGSKLFVYGKFATVSTTYEKIVGTANTGYVMLEVVTPPSGSVPLANPEKRGVTTYDYTNSQVWYAPCQYEMDDAYKGANVLPAKSKFILGFKGRLYVSGSEKDDDNIFITDAGNPYYFPVSLPLQIPPNSDKVSGLYVYDNSVLVSRSIDVYAVDGATNNPGLGFPLFELRRINTHVGMVNNKCGNAVENFFFYLGNDGNVYALSSSHQAEKTLSTVMMNVNFNLLHENFGLVLADLKGACSFYYRDLWYLSIKQYTFVFSMRHKAWTVYKGLNARRFYVLNDELIWGNESGYIGTWSEDNLDFGKPYESFWESKFFDMGDSISYKQFRDFYFESHTWDNKVSTIRIDFQLDYANVKVGFQVKNQISRWGVSRFGDPYLTRNVNVSTPFSIGRRSRRLKFTYRNGFDISLTVSGVSDLPQSNVDLDTFAFVINTNQYFLYKDADWVEYTLTELDQPMRVYQINGEYEFRGKR
jgi:hypothetical protein